MNIFEIYDKWQGIIPIFGGIYGLLLVYRVLPRKPKDAERLELWHGKFDKLMKILSPLLIIFGLWSLMSGLTNKENDKKKLLEHVTVIRTQAGVPDKNGQYPAVSTHGGYFIRFPAPFSEMEIYPSIDDKEKITTYSMAATLGDNKFSSLFLKYQDRIADKIKNKNEAIAKARTMAQVISITEKSIEGNPAIDLKLRNPKQDGEGFSRTIIADDGAFVLMVEFNQSNERNGPIAEKFFDSFQLRKSDREERSLTK